MFSEFPQESLLALLRGDIDRSLAAALFLVSDLSNVVIVQRHWRLLPCGKLCHRLRDLASTYIALGGINMVWQEDDRLPRLAVLLTATNRSILQSRHATKSHPGIRNQP
jgi:hypothetical protein